VRIERRKMERFDLKLPTKLSLAGKDKEHKSIELMTRNICSGGAFFKTNKPLTVGTDVKLAVILPLDKFKIVKHKILYIDVSGSVIRTDQQGMAIRFDRKYKISPH
jgi:Tfp pilus assembly protein PilZ